MITTTVKLAETQFKELIAAALRGEDVLITADDENGTAVRITRVAPRDELEEPRPRFGSAKGRIWIADDFDEPLDEFDEYR
jgi:antitoxin (DNA-binding transcriptional repressor) of toxin-antitoxin stability system